MLITIPKALRDSLGEEASTALVEIFNAQSQNTGTSITTLVEEKFERRLSEEMAKLRIEISKVREEGRKNQADTIRWLFIFWVGQIGAMLGILFAFFD